MGGWARRREEGFQGEVWKRSLSKAVRADRPARLNGLARARNARPRAAAHPRGVHQQERAQEACLFVRACVRARARQVLNKSVLKKKRMGSRSMMQANAPPSTPPHPHPLPPSNPPVPASLGVMQASAQPGAGA